MQAGERYDDTWTFDLAAKTWRDVSPSGFEQRPHHRCLHAATVYKPGKILLFGGCGSFGYGPCPQWDTWKYESDSPTQTGAWSREENCPPRRTYGAMAAYPAGKVTLFGGSGGPITSSDNAVNVFDLDSGKWSRFRPQNSPSPRVGPSLAVFTSGSLPTALILFGGDQFNELWRLTGDSEGASVEEIGCVFSFDVRALHGSLMFVAWGIFLPLGLFSARFLKWLPSRGADKKAYWFLIHLFFQISGLVLTLIAFILMFVKLDEGAGKFKRLPHAAFGIIIVLLAVWQPLNAYFRPHPKPLTKRRAIWQYLHWYSGRFAVVLALINIYLGILAIHGGQVLLGLYTGWLVVLLLLFVIGTFKKKKEGNMSWKDVFNPFIKIEETQ